MKKVLFGIVVLIVIIFIVTVSKDLKKHPIERKETTENSESVTLIENAEQFSRINVTELKNIVGEPVSEETWTNKTSKGDFEITTLSYDINSNHYEFLISDDSVIRLTIYSNAYWNNKGERFSITGKREDICKEYNITLGGNVKRVNDTNFVYTLSPVNDKVAMFDVQDIKDDSYGLVKITYNLNYFE